MGWFGKQKSKKHVYSEADTAALAQRSLDFIAEAVLVVDPHGMIKFANPAAAAMSGFGDPNNVTGLDYQLVIHLEDGQGHPIDPNTTKLYTAVMTNQRLNTREYVLVAAQSERRIAIDLACIPTGDEREDRIINFRDITKELAEEKEQAEFISTASHEMRTPVASIEGYIGLALNPQTATIDERAKKYLEAAHEASQHLGHLFKDLLDVTKFDDSRAKAHLIPVDAVEAVRLIASEQEKEMRAKQLRYSFGGEGGLLDKKRLTQKIYMAVDYDFLHEIVGNLVGNAIKYTPDGGEIKVSVRGDGDKVLITVKDSGIGIPSEDLGHIFQKFYRVDNSHTRQIGGTGLGLYLVQQRVEALGGRVWAESKYGEGSAFYVTLPRISESEYERMRIAYGNEKMMRKPFVEPAVSTINVELPENGGELARTVTGAPKIQIQKSQTLVPSADAAPVAPEADAAMAAGVTSETTSVEAAGAVGSGVVAESESSGVESHLPSADTASHLPGASIESHLPGMGGEATQTGGFFGGDAELATAAPVTPAETPETIHRERTLTPPSERRLDATEPAREVPHPDETTAATPTTEPTIKQQGGE